MSEYVPTADDFHLAWEVPGQRMRELDEKYVTAIERHHEAQRGIAALKAEALREAAAEIVQAGDAAYKSPISWLRWRAVQIQEGHTA